MFLLMIATKTIMPPNIGSFINNRVIYNPPQDPNDNRIRMKIQWISPPWHRPSRQVKTHAG